jgi:hypothetical protein
VGDTWTRRTRRRVEVPELSTEHGSQVNAGAEQVVRELGKTNLITGVVIVQNHSDARFRPPFGFVPGVGWRRSRLAPIP